MISEFNTGHCYVEYPFPPGALDEVEKRGSLGIDLSWDAMAKAYKITHILKGDAWNPSSRSPFAEPGLGVHEGDYLLMIGGVLLKDTQDPAALLIDTGDAHISVTVNSKPSIEGAKELVVRPVRISAEMSLRTQDWIESRRAYVAKASGGQIAYVYVGSMDSAGALQFARQYYPNVDMAGIIIDVRGNGGGSISANLLSDLSAKITGRFHHRAGGEYRRESWAPSGQVVAVTDEWAFSDGEFFSEFFKRLKIGPLVGHRSGGGEVGSGGGYPLIDGGSVYIPNYGAWVPGENGKPGEWVIEGRGAVPDFEVDQDPAEVMAGKDPQLDKAIAIILANLNKHPFSLPVHPPFPVKRSGSQGG